MGLIHQKSSEMKIKDLRSVCEDAIRRHEAGEMYTDRPVVLLCLPTKKVPRGDKIRLCGRHGPLGVILSCRDRPSQLSPDETPGLIYNNVSFDARKVLEFLRSAPE